MPSSHNARNRKVQPSGAAATARASGTVPEVSVEVHPKEDRATRSDPRQRRLLPVEASDWLDRDDGTDFFKGLVVFVPVGLLFWVCLWAIWRAIT